MMRASTAYGLGDNTTTTTSVSQNAMASKQRQYSHLSAQLQQLQKHVVTLDSHLRVSAEQAEYVKHLGGLQGGLFMAASRILGEEPETSSDGQ